jgi:hypothetical protein
MSRSRRTKGSFMLANRMLLVCFLLALSMAGCSGSPELVSETSVEEKLSRLRLGESDKSDVEGIFGSERGNDRDRWSYYFADKQFEISERRRGPGAGTLPVAAGTVATNTRAVVTVSFNEAGVVKTIEVARLFEPPFINEYWFLVKESAKDPVASIAALAETKGFKVAGLDAQTGSFDLEDPTSKGRISVRIDGRTLKVTSRNPHHRLAKEYRAYSKRESAFTGGIIDSDLVQ